MLESTFCEYICQEKNKTKINKNMKSFNLKIRPIKEKNDLTIIYKEGENNFHEIKTSKKEILHALRYYQKKSNEINQTGLIYIQESVPFNIFQRFISSIITQEIDIDENNYEPFLYLSRKYEYEELQKEIEDFIEKRPDICSIIDDLNSPINLDNQSSENEIKEEIIAKNLDVSIKNRILHKLPLQAINRIVNSPKRVIKDHRLLFSFVIETIKSKLNESDNKEDLDSLLILPSSLDYCSMTSDEIEELFEVENSLNFIQPQNSTEKIKNFIQCEKEMKMKVDSLEKRIQQNEELFKKEMKTKFDSLEEKIRQNEILYANEMKKKADSLEKKIQQNEELFKKEMKKKVDSLEEKIGQNEDLFSNEMKKLQKSIDVNEKQLRDNLVKNKEELVNRIDNYQRNLSTKIEEQKSQILKNEKTMNQVKNQSESTANQVKTLNDQLKIKQLKAESDIREVNKSLSSLQNELISSNCANGIFQYLFNKYNENPANKGLVNVTGNSFAGNQQLLPKIVDPNWHANNWWKSQYKENSYVRIDFNNSKVKIFKYRIKVGSPTGEYLFKSWILKGVNEDKQEIVLDKVNDSKQITANSPEATIQIKSTDVPFVRSIILVMKERSSEDDSSMRLRNIELFGDLVYL